MNQPPTAPADHQNIAKSTTPRRLAEIIHYHAHVYFDDGAREYALLLREQIAQRFAVDMGRLFERAVGPHPLAQYEAGFTSNQFAALIPWLMLNRGHLSILIHPNTDRELDDHFVSAMWLGQPIVLLRAGLVPSLQAAGQTGPRAVRVNTQPCLVP